MEIWYKYDGHDAKIVGKKKKYDNNIYTFDIETTSFITVDGIVYPAVYYDKLTEEDKKTKEIEYYATMYIWQFSINDKVYYGRTWEDLDNFLKLLEVYIPMKKYLFIHNQAFEFQFLKGCFNFSEVMARKSRKVMISKLRDYNFEIKCSYMMSNAALKDLPKLFNLPVEKKVGDLNYDLLRHSKTPITEKEMGYCEYDCLVLYYYILEELKTYKEIGKIPSTSTGHVRKELLNLTLRDYKYKRIVSKAVNTDPIVFNRLQDSFAGGITHASWLYSDMILEDVDSYDITSAYPYVLVAYKYPSSEFKFINIKKREEMTDKFYYILTVEFKNARSKYYNTYISSSKCKNLRGCKYDNGRVISAESFEMTITDIDFYLILDCYDIESYEIKEAWYSTKAYLPKKFIEFVLQKYVNKTQYKDNPEYELEYQKEKNKFNSLYGMSVTNNIRSDVIFDDSTGLWDEVELSNDDIIEKLKKEKNKGFLSFSYGVFVTALNRNNLFRRVMALDDYVVYMDTDSIKLVQGYDKSVFDKYNESVIRRINYVSKALRIPVEKFAPKDIHGVSHMLGVFDYETNGINNNTYKRFITQGAKKYAYERDEKDKKTKEIIKNKISITVAGVPKCGAAALKRLEDFKDNLYFPYEITHKMSIVYNDNQNPIELTDYLGNTYLVTDKSSACILPTSYVLGKSQDYQNLLIDNSSERARFNESIN